MADQELTPGQKKVTATIPLVSFVGKPNSGKTTLLETVIAELKSKGYRVGTIKHSHHHFQMDRPGKDTWRLAQAGSDAVIISSPTKMALIERPEAELTLSEIAALVAGRVDIILAEGYKNTDIARIRVVGSDVSEDEPPAPDNTLLTVPACEVPDGKPQFDRTDIARIVDILIARIDDGRRDDDQAGSFKRLLDESVALHGHLCAGQVLGVRMAMRGCQELGIARPREGKRLLIYLEIDRCASDAIQAVTGCRLGKRTLKHVDYGKLAATFVDLDSGNAVRVAVRGDSRQKATAYLPDGWTKREAEVVAYKLMPDDDLFRVKSVAVVVPAEDMPGPPLRRVICQQCGEEVNDGREVTAAGRVLCRGCVDGAYYQDTGLSDKTEAPGPACRHSQ